MQGAGRVEKALVLMISNGSLVQTTVPQASRACVRQKILALRVPISNRPSGADCGVFSLIGLKQTQTEIIIVWQQLRCVRLCHWSTVQVYVWSS